MGEREPGLGPRTGRHGVFTRFRTPEVDSRSSAGGGGAHRAGGVIWETTSTCGRVSSPGAWVEPHCFASARSCGAAFPRAACSLQEKPPLGWGRAGPPPRHPAGGQSQPTYPVLRALKPGSRGPDHISSPGRVSLLSHLRAPLYVLPRCVSDLQKGCNPSSREQHVCGPTTLWQLGPC